MNEMATQVAGKVRLVWFLIYGGRTYKIFIFRRLNLNKQALQM